LGDLRRPPENASGVNLVLEVRHVSGVESTIKPGQEEPGRKDIPPARLSTMMREAAREALAFLEEQEYHLRFLEDGVRFHSAALVIGYHDNVPIIFEEARRFAPGPDL
jgi:hypothetical protein